MIDFVAAVRSGDRSAVEAALSRNAKLAQSRDESGVSVICTAMYFGQQEIARRLVEARDDLDIFEACVAGEGDRVLELVSSAPELANAYSPDGFHPLGYTCFFGNPDIAEVLLKAGADIEAPARNSMQVRPLHSAVAHSDPEVALGLTRRLLEAGASPNVVQQGGFTPLHEAALRGHTELVQELLRYRADRGARDQDGRTPREIALERGHNKVAALLEAAV